jgi:hypothetical protein
MKLVSITKMEPENKKIIYELLLISLLLTSVILLSVNLILLLRDSGECVRHPKEFLINHFEKITKGNITCTCTTDNSLWTNPGGDSGKLVNGYQIIFSSFDKYESKEISQQINFKNVTIKK